jgi:hypothetical protein
MRALNNWLPYRNPGLAALLTLHFLTSTFADFTSFSKKVGLLRRAKKLSQGIPRPAENQTWCIWWLVSSLVIE